MEARTIGRHSPGPPPPALAPPPIFLFVRFACSGRFGHFVPTDSRLAVCVWLLSLSLMSSRLPRGAARVSPSAAPRVARARCAHAFTHGTPGILPFLGRREQGCARHSIVPAALPVCCLSLQARPFLRLKSKTYLFQTLQGAARCPHYKSRLLLWQLRVNDSKREQDRRPAPTLSPHPPPPGSHPVSSSPCPGQDTQQAACLRAAAKTRAWPSGWARPPHWPEIHFPVLLFLGSQVRLAPLLRSEYLHPPQFMCEILAPKGDRVGRGSFGRVIKSRGRSHLEWDLCPERSCRGPLPPPPVRTEKAPT